MMTIKYRKGYKRRIIAIILVICTVILSGRIPKESVLRTAGLATEPRDSSDLYISEVSLAQKDDAIVPSGYIQDYFADKYSVLGKRGGGNLIRHSRIIHIFMIWLYSVFSMPLLCSFYIDFSEEREQKRLIIKYIHDKDGLKSVTIT